MRLINKILIFVLVLGMPRTIVPQATQQPTITIDSKSQIYSFGQPIKLHVVLKNTTSRSFSVFRSVGGAYGEENFSISVTGPGGSPAPLTKYGEAARSSGLMPISRIMKTVAPGEAIDENINVDRMVDTHLAGEYVIQISRASPLDPAVLLKSNKLTITVRN
jgi:hypothetical protein